MVRASRLSRRKRSITGDHRTIARVLIATSVHARFWRVTPFFAITAMRFIGKDVDFATVFRSLVAVFVAGFASRNALSLFTGYGLGISFLTGQTAASAVLRVIL